MSATVTARFIATLVFAVGASLACGGGRILAATEAATATAPAGATAASDARCATLATLAIPDVRITATRPTAAGTAWASAAGDVIPAPAAVARPFCRVQGIIETEIAFELWLPEPADWNGRFLGAGVGGAAGTFNFADLPRGVDRGYAAATTDTGHKAGDTTWMLGDPQRLQNYELRANHLLAVRGKQITAAYYGRPASRSYFIGCSGGGRQGLKEVQRFPEDYDGVISGANGPRTPEMTVRRMWELLQRDAHPGLIAPAGWKRIADAGAKACDSRDGVADGVAEDPRQCRFDVAALACRNGQTTDCLTAEQVGFARQFYAPLRDATGRAIDGGILPGVLIDSGRSALAIGTFGQAIRRRADWDGRDFDVAADLAAINRVMPELRADATDVGAFTQRGGKLLMYTGWMDPAVSANMVIAYRNALVAAAGGERQADEFLRLYMLPGVEHCRGGPGADNIGGSGVPGPDADAEHDLLTALENWVERGQAPGPLIASKLENGKVARTHRICPYPQQAKYLGRGATGDAANYRCTR